MAMRVLTGPALAIIVPVDASDNEVNEIPLERSETGSGDAARHAGGGVQIEAHAARGTYVVPGK
jgi:hypothetical protein